MKILLINPPTLAALDPALPKILQEKEDPMPPLGLMYVAAYLKRESDCSVKILDCQVEQISHHDLIQKIKEENPDFVGLTVMTFSLLAVLKTIKIIKKVDPSIKVILGGPHIHIYPHETLSFDEVDFVVLGEGEATFCELLSVLKNNGDLYRVKGIGFKEGKKTIVNELHELITDLDSLPFPNRYELSYKKYVSALSERSPVTTMFTSRGCPFRCVFCNRPNLGKVFRWRSAQNVVDEIEECCKVGIREILIYDDTFTVNRQRVVDICENILERKLDIYWDVRARVDTVDYELLKLMAKAGCRRIHFGVEAGTQKVIDALRKGITLEKVEIAFASAKKASIRTLAYFMIGSPSETKEDILETIKFAKKLDPDFAHFSITAPYPATELYAEGLKSGLLPFDYWKKFAENPSDDFEPMVWTENLTKKELESLNKRAYRSFYWRPKYILKTLKNIKSPEDFIRKAGAGLKILKI